MASLDSFKCRKTLSAGGKTYTYYSLPEAEKNGLAGISKLPFSMKVLLENLLRHEDGRTVTKADIENVAAWLTDKGKAGKEIGFRPARVLMQDFTGVPAVVDLAAMRDGMKRARRRPAEDQSARPRRPRHRPLGHRRRLRLAAGASARTSSSSIERNGERYNFLKWGQGAFDNFRVVPPGTGICHQVNLEYLAQTVWTRTLRRRHRSLAYPDTLVGTDSHTTMVNGLAVLGWGVGGIEAEAAMLGQPQSMLLPEVIGFKLTGKLTEGVTATDLVLTVTQMLRKKGVVGKFVEFYGPGLATMPLADRATIANMAPGVRRHLRLLPDRRRDARLSRPSPAAKPSRIALVEAYAKAQGMFRANGTPDPVFTDTLELDLATVVPSMAGPKRPAGPRRAHRRRHRLRQGAGDRIQEAGRARRARAGRGPRLRPRPRRRRHRRHHHLHQHLEPERADRRRPARPQGGRQGPQVEAVGEDLAGARLAGRHRLSRQGRPAARPRQARLQPRRLRLHHLHRQLRPAGAGDLRRRSTRTTSSPPPCSPATATSKAASAPTCRPTTSPRRRWSSPTRSPARCRWT